MSNIIPPINSKGIFRVKSPLTNYIKQDIQYTITNIRNIRDMVDDGLDVLNIVYLQQGLTKDQYTNDLANNEVIVTFKAPNGSYYYVPSNMILSVPDVSGVIYVEKTIGINLGVLPKNLDIDFIKTDIKNLILDKLGVKADVVIVDTSEEYVYTYTESETMEKQRKGNIKNGLSIVAQYNKLLTSYNELKQRMTQLVNRYENVYQALQDCQNNSSSTSSN